MPNLLISSRSFKFAGLVFGLCLISLFFIEKRNSKDNILASELRHLEQKVHSDEKLLNAYLEDTILIRAMLRETYDFEDLENFHSLRVSVFAYSGDTMLFWSKNNNILPGKISDYPDGNTGLKLKNGLFELIKRSYNGGNITAAGLIPVQYEYSIQSSYLKDGFSDELGIPPYLHLSIEPDEGYKKVSSISGETIFYLGWNNSYEGKPRPALYYIVFSVLIICLVFLFYANAEMLARQGYYMIGLSALLLPLVLVRFIMIHYSFPDFVREISFFNPHYYASSVFTPSLADLLVNLLLVLLVVIYFHRHVHIGERAEKLNSKLVSIKSILGILTLIIFVHGGILMIRSLVVDSKISFDIYNFLTLDIYSFVGLLCLAVILLIIFISSRIVNSLLRSENKSILNRLINIAIAVLIYMLVLISRAEMHDLLVSVSFTFGLFLISWILEKRSVITISFAGLVIWIVFFATFSSYLLIEANEIKNRETMRLYALKKAGDRDPVTEFLFDVLRSRLSEDNFVRKYFEFPFSPGNQVQQRIEQLYFSGYLKKYNVLTRMYTDKGKPFGSLNSDGPTLQEYYRRVQTEGEETDIEGLYYINGPEGDNYYLADIPIDLADSLQAFMVIEMRPQSYTGTRIYPELLLEDRMRDPEEFSRYDLAIYQDNVLINSSGVYPYSYYDNFRVADSSDISYMKEGGYFHLVYKPGQNRKVVITYLEGSAFRPVSLFSYLFVIYLIFTGIFLLGRWVKNVLNGSIESSALFSTSMRNKIHSFVIFIIMFSFILILVVTVFYFRAQYNNYHQQRLLRKVQSVMTGFEYLGINPNDLDRNAEKFDRFSEDLNLKLASLADIHSMDINVFDIRGNLVSSSQMAIFDKALLSHQMDPLAWFKMACDKEIQYIQTENIGKLEFLSAYVPLQTKDGLELGYLNLPYFDKETLLREDISQFMVTLINVYVFLLVFAGFIALLVSNSITVPLAVIGSKFRKFELGGINEPIEWSSHDEIGKLVSEYNSMIRQLEDSAKLLAKSERESAWREMAKQVAHEIKNPLTPMRLSIQHLERSISAGAPDIEERVKRVSKTLIEQIDNLSHIASEFSTFAKMPTTQNEKLDMREILENELLLFRDNANIHFELEMDQDAPCLVWADRNQMLRVFNNLIKNAIQAIPDGEEGNIVLGIEREADYWLLKVVDDGSGIPDDAKQKVFVPNFTTKSSGMGLGLAMAKSIVENSGGEIWFESREGRGTTFFLRLPVLK